MLIVDTCVMRDQPEAGRDLSSGFKITFTEKIITFIALKHPPLVTTEHDHPEHAENLKMIIEP